MQYYTPKIQEFCVGFEFEEYDNGWNKVMYDTNFALGKIKNQITGANGMDWTIDGVDQEHPICKIRVKVLDKEDIEECGFIPHLDYYKKVTKVKEIGEQGIAVKCCEKCGNNIYAILKYYWDDLGGGEDVVFKGIIKNKSEFKKLITSIDFQPRKN